MKIRTDDTKIQLTKDNIQSFLWVVTEYYNQINYYIEPMRVDKITKKIYEEALKTIAEKLYIIQFRAIGIKGKKIILSISEIERLILYVFVNLYPLPLDINFIEYEIIKKQTKN